MLWICAFFFGALALPCAAGAGGDAFQFYGLGDSLSEPVQSADANYATQTFGYLNLIAYQAHYAFPLPYIQSGLFGSIYSTNFRSRISPYTLSHNLASSGADVDTLLHEAATALDPSQISTEAELVLFPRTGTQMEIAEAAQPDLAVCWIGSNDALSAILDFNHLDASQLTPVAQFDSDFEEIAQRLSASSARTVFANIPDVTDIAFLLDRDDLVRLLGSDYGLPAGDYTTLVAMLLIKLGLNDGSILADPNYVLDAGEVAVIQDRIAVFNQEISDTAALYNLPVVDIHGLFNSFTLNPPVILGVQLTPRFLGGLFSLDGVHPSDIGQAYVADAFIQAINHRYGLGISTLNPLQFLILFSTDPFIDKDGDGRVTGRLGFGLLETVAWLLGYSGDSNDYVPNAAPRGDAVLQRARARAFLEQYKRARGMDPGEKGTVQAFREIFGLK